jgi:benzoate membrane transport protein
VPTRLSLPIPTVTNPVFSVHAIATATPVLVILITLQSNLPSVVFLQNQGYHPPERVIDNVSGVGTLLGSLLGPTAVSLSLPATALVAGPHAGEHQLRHRAVYLASGAVLLIALLAGIAADLPAIIPLRLLLTLAGLAVVDLLANALQQITRGPLLLGPMFAFAIALSEISILGFGPFFWALVIGTGISFLLERDKLQELRSPVPVGEERSGS